MKMNLFNVCDRMCTFTLTQLVCILLHLHCPLFVINWLDIEQKEITLNGTQNTLNSWKPSEFQRFFQKWKWNHAEICFWRSWYCNKYSLIIRMLELISEHRRSIILNLFAIVSELLLYLDSWSCLWCPLWRNWWRATI